MAAAVVFLMDMSGSMMNDRDAAINGMNRWISAIAKKMPRVPITISFFNNYMVNYVTDTPASKIPPVRIDKYVPGGGTAILDAIGSTIHYVENDAMPLDGALMYIYTDGGENSSTHYSRHDIYEKIQKLQTLGWTFEYMSSTGDARSFASSIGINRIRNVEQSSSGYGKMYDQMSAGVIDWLDGK